MIHNPSRPSLTLACCHTCSTVGPIHVHYCPFSHGFPPRLQAVLSRAELLLSSECSAQPALDAAVSAMEGAVDAWSRVEAEEAEKRRKEAEILKYKMQEHLVRLGV